MNPFLILSSHSRRHGLLPDECGRERRSDTNQNSKHGRTRLGHPVALKRDYHAPNSVVRRKSDMTSIFDRSRYSGVTGAVSLLGELGGLCRLEGTPEKLTVRGGEFVGGYPPRRGDLRVSK